MDNEGMTIHIVADSDFSSQVSGCLSFDGTQSAFLAFDGTQPAFLAFAGTPTGFRALEPGFCLAAHCDCMGQV